MAQSVVSDASKVGDNYYRTKVVDNGDGTYGSTLFRTDANGGNEVPIAGYGAAGTTTSTEINTTNATAEEQQLLADPNSQLNQVRRQQVQSTEDDFFGATGGTAQQKEALNKSAGKANQATKPEAKDSQGSSTPVPAGNASKAKARKKFPSDLKYPSNLQIEHQDVIKFNMLEYDPKSFNAGTNGGLGGFDEERSKYDERIIGSVFLPIQGSISDTNAVTWGSETMNPAEAAAANIALTGITEGGKEAANKLSTMLDAAKKSKDVGTALAAKFAEAAAGTSGILARTQGSIINPNMELLFQGPSLRPFSFTFRLSARNTKDKDQITQIIRFFKQGMAVQRTESQLFLKAPHTFKIQYLHKSKDHQYINKIKECALQSFNVNYTPEGTYMTFADGLMTSYEITMQFQELEPIFNDDYGNIDGASVDTEIGY